MKMTQYLKWKADPSKGEVFTPISLVSEMLDKIPDEVWKNPNSKFLDPCMGKGTFLIEIVRRLTYIYGYTETDAKSRVYGYDIRVKYINHLNRRGFVNVRHKDFLKEIIEMQFDVIVGNPPYQENSQKGKSKGGGRGGDKNLYSKFISKSFSLLSQNGFLFFLVPPSILSPKNTNRDIILSETNNLKLIKFFDKNPFPNVNTNVCYFLLKKGETKQPTKVLFKNNELHTILGINQIFPSNFDSLTLSIFSKFFTKDSQKFEVHRDCSLHTQNKKLFSKEQTITHNYPVYSGSKTVFTSTEPKNLTIPKIVISRSGYYKPILDLGTKGTTESNFFVTGENLQEKFNLLNHPLYKFVVESSKFNGYINQMVLKCLPSINETNNVYDYFELSHEEIQHIENNVR